MSEEEREYADMWVAPEADPRGQGFTHGERETVLEYLADYRKTLVMKCDGLTPEQLATASVPPSNLSLLGLVRHVAAVEQSWATLRALRVRTIYPGHAPPQPLPPE